MVNRNKNIYSNTLFNNLGGYSSIKDEDVHNQLYTVALNRYLNTLSEDIDEYKSNHIFNEIKAKEYYLPSKVIIRSIVEPYVTRIVDLSAYWDEYEFNRNIKKMNEDYFEDKEDINAFVVIYIDYVNGKVKIKNKNTGKIIWKDIEYFKNGNIPIDKDELTLNGTFIYELKNNKD